MTATSARRRLPKYEAGFGVATFYIPDYPGSDEMTARALPLPYVIYRGDIFRADREGGLRSRLLKRATTEFDLSLGASFPSNSDRNKARKDMADLDWLGEIGPKLLIHMHPGKKWKADLVFPLRFVFSTDFQSAHARGFLFHPEISFSRRFSASPGLRLRLSSGVTYATENLMDYFYTVGPGDATADRPQYKADGGYFGSNLSVTLIKFFMPQKVALFAGVSNNFFGGAKNEDSPLMKDTYNASYFLGVAVGLYESKELESAGGG